ncbi:hypothetical protein LIER_13203 [Lithospermum erythrorhizon]|uniref:RNase H type-1 domain-containing protein n=1 Tax=Lithospermum erythrorhizon TaxID=34254 RepID=A0AAV3PZU8_LITER
MQMAKEYKDANSPTSGAIQQVSRGGTVTEFDKWRVPAANWVKLNSDAKWCKESCKCYAGAVIRDRQGKFLGAQFNDIGIALSALMAEALALPEGVMLARELNWNCVEFESDSKVLIQALRGEIGTPVEIDVIIWDVLQWSKNMNSKLQFIKSTVNNAAHLVAHWDCGSELLIMYLWSTT